MVRTAADRSEAAVAAFGKAARRTRAQISWPKACAARRHSRRHCSLTDLRRAHQVHERLCLAKLNPPVQPASVIYALSLLLPPFLLFFSFLLCCSFFLSPFTFSLLF